VLSKPTGYIYGMSEKDLFSFFSTFRRAAVVLVSVAAASSRHHRHSHDDDENVSQIRVNVPDTQKRLCYNNVPRRSVANRTVYNSLYIIQHTRSKTDSSFRFIILFSFLYSLLLSLALFLFSFFLCSDRFFYVSCTPCTL